MNKTEIPVFFQGDLNMVITEISHPGQADLCENKTDISLPGHFDLDVICFTFTRFP